MISLSSPHKTIWHRWPAGLKLGLLCLWTLSLFAFNRLDFQIAAFLVCVGLYLIPGWAFIKFGLKSLFLLWPFVLVIAIWHSLSGAVDEGAIIVLRLLSAFGIANLVTMTTNLSDMIEVVQRLLSPLRFLGIRTRSLEIALALSIRFVPVLVQKGRGLVNSWRARSAKRPSWRIVVPFALLAIDDAEQIAEALRARGGIIED